MVQIEHENIHNTKKKQKQINKIKKHMKSLKNCEEFFFAQFDVFQ